MTSYVCVMSGPCLLHVSVMSTPCVRHACPMSAPWLRHVCVMSASYLPACVMCATVLCHICIMSASSLCRACIMSVSCLRLGCVMLMPCLCHVWVMSASRACHEFLHGAEDSQKVYRRRRCHHDATTGSSCARRGAALHPRSAHAVFAATPVVRHGLHPQRAAPRDDAAGGLRGGLAAVLGAWLAGGAARSRRGHRACRTRARQTALGASAAFAPGVLWRRAGPDIGAGVGRCPRFARIAAAQLRPSPFGSERSVAWAGRDLPFRRLFSRRRGRVSPARFGGGVRSRGRSVGRPVGRRCALDAAGWA